MALNCSSSYITCGHNGAGDSAYLILMGKVLFEGHLIVRIQPYSSKIRTVDMFASRFLSIKPRLSLGSFSSVVRHQSKLFMSSETRKAIDEAVASAPVVLFMKGTPEFPQCGFSRATVQMLGQQGVDPAKFAAYNVLEDPELREGIKEYSEWPTIPQLYVNKEFIGGCDILTNMAQTGDLAALLEEADALVPEDGE
ncbi:hypothetical protein HG536_0H01220 [Torulaspora globosa]|uniref:Monothiol glutaredoxin-5, mitochondrial n=1 Tax=Torulaspora globosa TaxID=48254 RepID=A0A7G3ZML1_9SACH|nr:uncharacterized protein HG536_0H01220 [Torulaspora globosa]QLL34747.1 hypothetical protein HG536_0H01220 [Torulaspora globosa]